MSVTVSDVSVAVTPLLTTRTVAEYFNVSPETVLRWHRSGQLSAVRLASNQLRFHVADIKAFLAEREERSGSTE